MIFSKEDAENLQGAVVRLRSGQVVDLTPAKVRQGLGDWYTYYHRDKMFHAFANMDENDNACPDDIVEVLKWPPGHPLAEMTPERAIEILIDGHPLEEVRREAMECLLVRAQVWDDWIDINEAEPLPGQEIFIGPGEMLRYSHWSEHAMWRDGGTGINQAGVRTLFTRWKPVRT